MVNQMRAKQLTILRVPISTVAIVSVGADRIWPFELGCFERRRASSEHECLVGVPIEFGSVDKKGPLADAQA